MSKFKILTIAILLSSCSNSGSSDSSPLPCLGIMIFVFILLLLGSRQGGGNPPPVYTPTENVKVHVSENSEIKIVNPQLEKVAQGAVQYAKQTFNLDLDYSLTSLSILGIVLTTLSGKKRSENIAQEKVTSWMRVYGSYLGEIVRQKWGGDWIREIDKLNNRSAVYLSSKGTKINPFAPVQKALDLGNINDIYLFIEESRKRLDFEIANENAYDPDIDGAVEFTPRGFPYKYYWDGRFGNTLELMGVVEDLQECNFPFTHQTQASVCDIRLVGSIDHNRQIILMGKSFTITLAPYVFEKEFHSPSNRSSKLLILSAYSKRNLVDLMQACGFIIGKEKESPKVVQLDTEFMPRSIQIPWFCPHCKNRNMSPVEQTGEAIVRCSSCSSTYRCLIGMAESASSGTVSFLSKEEYVWAIRITNDQVTVNEITFMTSNPEMSIRKNDFIIVLFSQTVDGYDKLVYIENRTTLKSLML